MKNLVERFLLALLAEFLFSLVTHYNRGTCRRIIEAYLVLKSQNMENIGLFV